MNKRFLTSILALIFIGTLDLSAQTDAQLREIKVAAIDIVGKAHTLWLRTGTGKDAVEVPLNTRVFSPVLKYKGGGVALFYKSKADATAEKPPKPFARVVLKNRKSLIVFTPASKGGGYRAYAIQNSSFPFGSFRMVNFSKLPVLVDLGRRQSVLKTNQSKTFTFPNGKQSVPVKIQVKKEDGKIRVIRQTTWSVAATQRELVFFFPNPQNKLVRARHFVDSKDTDLAKGAADGE